MWLRPRSDARRVTSRQARTTVVAQEHGRRLHLVGVARRWTRETGLPDVRLETQANDIRLQLVRNVRLRACQY